MRTRLTTIAGQARDLCQTEASKDIFDLWKGQKTEVDFDVTNDGGADATGVVVGLSAEEPYVAIRRWNIDSKQGSGSFVLDAANDSQTIGHDSPGQRFELELGTIKKGQTKRVRLAVAGERSSLGAADAPDIRAWVARIGSTYEKTGFSAKPTKNVGGHQTWNQGDLRVRAEIDVLDQELCDGFDNDCDGETDEECSFVWPDSGGGGRSDGGPPPPPPPLRTNDPTLDGSGCSVGGRTSRGPVPLLLLFAFLWTRRLSG
jgi:hypothetical protein